MQDPHRHRRCSQRSPSARQASATVPSSFTCGVKAARDPQSERENIRLTRALIRFSPITGWIFSRGVELGQIITVKEDLPLICTMEFIGSFL